jgi:uncharacterized membrane protein YbhN (UPF0104 family)
MVFDGMNHVRHTQRPLAGERMRQLLTEAARRFNATIGWNRLGFVISLIIVAAALSTLFRILAGVDVDGIVRALRAMPLSNVVFAALFVGCAYFTLTFYDAFSLRTIGRADIPYRVAAFASLTSYTIGHNIGATVFTGNAVRLRIYSAWGVGLVEIGKIAFITGLTFWLGNAFVLGLGIALHPQAASTIDGLSPLANRTLAICGLAAIVAYLAWLVPRPRAVFTNQWRIVLPSAPLTLVQIGIGLLDLGSAGLAMYFLLPPTPAVDFATVLVVFVIATLLGFLSHAPGGLGVFDAAMLVSLPQFDKEALIAALLLFRLLYYIIPFALALSFLGLREAIVILRPEAIAARAKRRDGQQARDERGVP